MSSLMSLNCVVEQSQAMASAKVQSLTRCQQRTILVIEDSDVIRRVLTLILEAEGYRVIECANGSKALELAREVKPDLITLDLALSDVDGREVLQSLRKQRWALDLPVVVLSAYAHVLTGVERAQVTDVIVKPFDLDDLVQRLKLAIEHQPEDRS